MLYCFTAGQNMSTYYWKIYQPDLDLNLNKKLIEFDQQLEILLQNNFEEQGDITEINNQQLKVNNNITENNIIKNNG